MSGPVSRLLCVLSCLALLISGCKFGGTRDSDDLRGFLYRYQAVVRWGDLHKMYAFLRPGTEVQIPAGLENIRVTSYETVASPLPEAEGRWVQTVEIQYLHRDRQQLETLIDRQVWVKDPEIEHWYRDNPIPPFP